MRAIKERGIDELNMFRNRVVRAFGLMRISKESFNILLEKTDEIKKIVNEIEELDEEEVAASASSK